jgi:hypothetical protein
VNDSDIAVAPNVGATLRRNRVEGGSTGIFVARVTIGTLLDSNLVTGTASRGLEVRETGDVAIENLTAWGNTSADIQLTDASVSIDSSIVQDEIVLSGGTSCGITFSRGPTTTGGDSCKFFTTTMAPNFVSATDLRLTAASIAMIDQGNTIAPTGTADFEGDPRQSETDCTSSGTERRDMGADEFLDCGSSGATISSPVAGAVTDATPTVSFSGIGLTPTLYCSIDGSVPVLCGSPRTYVGLADGPHTFSVRNGGVSGNGQTVSRSFNVDGSAPETAIESGPADAGATGPSTGFSFASEPGATFQCSLDGATFAACSSPATMTDLGEGAHTFVVRAVDAVGNVDPTPVARTWNVDATPPDTTIDSGPADGATTAETTATYGFSSEASATYECSLDGAAFAACTSPRVLTGLDLGAHTFAVRASDQYGNVDPTPASRSLTITASPGGDDTQPPETTIKKLKLKGGDGVVIRFKSSERGSSFECKLDKRKFKRCKSPKRYKRLDAGKHKFRVRAIDLAGNPDPSPARKRFRI